MRRLEHAAGTRTRSHPTQLATDYDVVVVGSRVAGASTAMLLARQGHRVLMVDRVRMPSDVVSTHAVLRSGVLQLKRWGILDRVVEAGTPPIQDIVLGFGEERIGFQVKDEYGVDTLYAPRRTVLDQIVVEAAVDAGAEFAEATRMVDLLHDGGRVSGIVAGSNGRETRVSSRIVIGADGVWSRTAELVDAPAYERHPATNAVTYAYYDGVDVPGFWFQFTPGVNAGVIPTNDGLSCVFVGRPTQEIGRFRADPQAEFDRLLRRAGEDLSQRVGSGSRVTGFRGTDGLPGFLRQPWGPGWALVGDAGYTKDPISAHGISDAMRDAELCARAIDQALSTPGDAQEAMGEYQTTRDRLSREMFRESMALARYEWDANEASVRMRRISDLVRAECEALESLGQWAPAFSAA